ncbi:MAG: shikimate kinase [Nitrososphaerota archaeon]|nr:shikimate kinase [Nitrososphaerota archaeon]MDG6938824.1 shikimate kinase [Nitrososphaerota archaeon]
MKGRGRCHGAVSIVNAIPSGRGAAVGVALGTEAAVEMSRGAGGWSVSSNGASVSSPLLVRTAELVLASRGEPAGFGGRIDVSTEIPMGRGLKSSSSSSVAVALAVLSALGERRYRPEELLRWSVDASLATGVSVTGAMDDAAACLLGGVNHCDNSKRLLLRSSPSEQRLAVLIKVPPTGSNRGTADLGLVRKFAGVADGVFDMSMAGMHWPAMTLNGLLCSSLFGYESEPALQAVRGGALGAGLSGTGPAVAAVFPEGAGTNGLKEAWGRDGSLVIETETTDAAGELIGAG